MGIIVVISMIVLLCFAIVKLVVTKLRMAVETIKFYNGQQTLEKFGFLHMDEDQKAEVSRRIVKLEREIHRLRFFFRFVEEAKKYDPFYN